MRIWREDAQGVRARGSLVGVLRDRLPEPRADTSQQARRAQASLNVGHGNVRQSIWIEGLQCFAGAQSMSCAAGGLSLCGVAGPQERAFHCCCL